MSLDKVQCWQHVQDMCYHLSKKIKIKFIFEKVLSYIHEKCMSYKINFISIRILIKYKVRVAI